MFLIVLEYLGMFESINKGSPGLKIPEIMDMLGFGLVLHIIKSRFYLSKIDQNHSPELLNLLSEHFSI